jgi:hypothetical protein
MYVVGQVVKYYGRAGVEFALHSHVLSVLISLQQWALHILYYGTEGVEFAL